MNSSSLFSTEHELIGELSKQRSFHLPRLLNTLKLGIGGRFNGGALDLLNVSFNVKEEIDNWRLIDYAARDNDSLSLRFLLLVHWDLKHKNGDGKRTLEIAAEYGGPQRLSALLNLPITSYAEENFLNEKEKVLLALRNDLGDNPLLIAAEKGRPEKVQFLICCGADILCHRRGNIKLNATSLAWDAKHYENMQVLLESDSPFPNQFKLNEIEQTEYTAALMKQVEGRKSLHQAIKKGFQDILKTFIKYNPRLKHAYDPSNQSALMTALKAGQYEYYAQLQSKGYSAGTDEQLTKLLEGLNHDQKRRLKEAKLKYFEKPDDYHITYLLSKSRLGFGQETRECFDIILELYKQLNAIPEISTILKVVEHSERLEIIFDFNRNSIIDLNPTQSSTRGLCDYKAGRIYVGAKEKCELLGTLAHKLAHLAMEICYENECNPFEAQDERKKYEFGKIVAGCRGKTGIDNIIKRVFTAHKNESDWPSELIVRVPHPLAHYEKKEGKQLLTQQVSELLTFYEQRTQEDLRKIIEKPARLRIRRLNKLLGKMDEIEQSNIWLNDECLLKDDVIKCQHILILSSPLPKLTILNLCQVMIKEQCNITDIKSGYIFVSAEQFQDQDKLASVCEAFQSITDPALVIDCSYDSERIVADVSSILNRFSEKVRIIVIAVPSVAESLHVKLKECQAEIVEDRDYKWSDLTPDSQNELLKNKVCFQGSTVSLNELISAESRVTKFLPLADLLEKRTLEIGRPLLTSADDSFIENYYIPRTFNHQVAIKKDNFKKEFSDLVATNEQEFKKNCQDNPEKNVHWILKDQSGRQLWQQSCGSLRALHEHIDTRNPLPYPPKNLNEFLQKAQCQKVMLIADTAGMGKTTVLNHLSKQIKQKFPTYWLVRIDLNDHTQALEAQMNQKIESTEFLCEKLLKFRYPFEKELFKECCEGLEEATKVIIMFDGFDEISPNYKKTVLDLLQDLNPLKQSWIEQLWVTTRPHLRKELEDNLKQMCYTLEPFSEDNQVAFLTEFWHQHSKLQEESRQHSKEYARALIKLLARSVSDKEKEFTGIPLQTRMLAEAFEKEFETYCLSQKSEPKLPKQLCLVDLYRKFMKEKINIFKSKGRIVEEQDADIFLSDISITRNHQKLALEVLLPEMKDTVLKLEENRMLETEEISRIGIVQYVDDKPHFIHRSFAEYYVADFLATQLTKETYFPLEVLNIMFTVLLGKEYEGITHFLDGLLVNIKKSKALKQYGKQIYKLWEDKEKFMFFKIKRRNSTREKLQTALEQAAEKGSTNTIDFFFGSLKANGNTNIIKKMLLNKKNYAKPVAGKKTLQPLWGWAGGVHVNQKYDLVLDKGYDRRTAWDRGAKNGNKEILETLWRWGREVKVNLKNDLLLAKGYDGKTAWDIASKTGNKEILETLCGWGREVKINLKDDLLLAKGTDRLTAWDRASRNGNKEM